MAPAAWHCPDCGFAPSTVGPKDAEAAVRSYPRRWRALLVRPDEPDPEIVHRRPAPDKPCALDHAMASAAGMAAAAVALQRVHGKEHPDVDPGPVPEAAPAAPGAAGRLNLALVLDDVADGAGALNTAMGLFHGDAWTRGGLLPGGHPVSALDLARVGVHAGTHHLRAAERVLAELRLLH